jgi:hypothetical protein
VWAAPGFNDAPATAILLHGAGRTRQTVPVPHTGSCPVTGIAPDGAGGIWVIPCQSNWLGAQYLHWQADRGPTYTPAHQGRTAPKPPRRSR